jgi:hypothetical protein
MNPISLTRAGASKPLAFHSIPRMVGALGPSGSDLRSGAKKQNAAKPPPHRNPVKRLNAPIRV